MVDLLVNHRTHWVDDLDLWSRALEQERLDWLTLLLALDLQLILLSLVLLTFMLLLYIHIWGLLGEQILHGLLRRRVWADLGIVLRALK